MYAEWNFQIGYTSDENVVAFEFLVPFIKRYVSGNSVALMTTLPLAKKIFESRIQLTVVLKASFLAYLQKQKQTKKNRHRY